MIEIEVLFSLPSEIQHGLALGQLERVGGIIRYADTKQVLMWLQEGGRAASNLEASKGLLASIMRQSSMSSAAMGAVFGTAASTLNLAISGYSLYLLIERVRELEKQIETIHERVSQEFARDRRIDFEAALSNARDIVDTDNEIYKQQAANTAIDQLFKARQHRLADFDALMNTAADPLTLQQAQIYLLQAMHCDSLRARCYLETNQTQLARVRLTESLNEYKLRTEQLLRKWLGKYPARYFHSEVSDEDFNRFLGIEEWLRDKKNILPELILEYRKDFWNRDAVKTASINLPNINLPFLKTNEKLQEAAHLIALTQCELLIENYQRLQGFEIELASIRLRFEDWDRLVNQLESYDDYVLLVDTEAFEAVRRLSS